MEPGCDGEGTSRSTQGMVPWHPAFRSSTCRISRSSVLSQFAGHGGSEADQPAGTHPGVVSFDLPARHPPSCAPFAPGPLRPFVATTGALTPARPARSRGALRRSAPSTSRSPGFTPSAFRLFRLPAPAHAPPRPVGARSPISGSDRDYFLSGLSSLSELGASPLLRRLATRSAESSSGSSPFGETSYGLVVHLLLLPTPSRDDAVAVGYKLR